MTCEPDDPERARRKKISRGMRAAIAASGRTLPPMTEDQARYYKTKRRYGGMSRAEALEAIFVHGYPR